MTTPHPAATTAATTPGGHPYRQFPHRYAGSDPQRQSVGDPGHCEDCVSVGHLVAHPDLGCGDVGCPQDHDTPSMPRLGIGIAMTLTLDNRDMMIRWAGGREPDDPGSDVMLIDTEHGSAVVCLGDTLSLIDGRWAIHHRAVSQPLDGPPVRLAGITTKPPRFASLDALQSADPQPPAEASREDQ